MKVKLGGYIQEHSVRNKANEDIPVYSVTNTQGFCQDYFGKEVASKDKSTYKIVPRGYFAYNPSRINVGSVDWQRDEDQVIVSPLYNVFSVSPELNQQYLYYYLKSDFALHRIKAVATGSVRDNLKLEMLKNFPIRIPSVEEQEYIVQALDKAKNIIDLRRNELQKFDDLIRARFVEMFGNGHDGFCNTKKLGEFCKFQQGTQIPVEEQIEEQLEGYTRFLRIIDYTQAPQIPRYVSVKGREIAEDSVVIVRYGATAGFVGHGYAGILANNLFEVVPDESILSKDFLYLALKYGTFEQEVHDKAFGAAMPALSFGMMNDIGVVTPNSTAQNGFVDFVKQVDKSKATVQKALDETQLLFDSLMQQYFG